MADVARGHGGDGGGEDPSRPRPPSFGCEGCFVNRGKGKQNPNLGGRRAGRENTRDKTLCLKLLDAVAANHNRPVEIDFVPARDNLVTPVGPYAEHWGNLFRLVIREIPLYYPSWSKVPEGHKAAARKAIEKKYDLASHRSTPRWQNIHNTINAQLQKSYNTNKATLKRDYCVKDPETGEYDVDRIRRNRPNEHTVEEWEKQIAFWTDANNKKRSLTNSQNPSKATLPSRHGSRSIPHTRQLMKKASETQQEPSEIDMFYHLHTNEDGVFAYENSLQLYMRELEATGEHTAAEINRMVRGGKFRGHHPGVGMVLLGYANSSPSFSSPPPDTRRDLDFVISILRDDGRYADHFTRYESAGASGSGSRPGDDAEDREGGEDGGDDAS